MHIGQYNPAATAPQSHGVGIGEPTDRDVLNGRGQGVQRHEGNVNYRKLVKVNKHHYATCPDADKSKISKGIVAAVRALGGRFLEVNADIGDKKATEKTSQALREGLKKVREAIFEEERRTGRQPSQCQERSAEAYFGYSCKVLEALYNADGNELDRSTRLTTTTVNQPEAIEPISIANMNTVHPAATTSNQSDAFEPIRIADMINDARTYEVGGSHRRGSAANAAQMEMVRDQFPGDDLQRASIGRFTNDLTLGRLTDMSFTSVFSADSLRRLTESARNERLDLPEGNQGRDSINSVLSNEIGHMIRETESQLMQVERMTIDDMLSEDAQVDVKGEDGWEERMSGLRLTEMII